MARQKITRRELAVVLLDILILAAADGLALALCHARSSTSLLSGLERNS